MRSKSSYIFKLIFSILTVSVILFWILGEYILERDTTPNDESWRVYEGEWTWIKEDGTSEVAKIPGICNAKRNEVVTITSTLSDDIVDRDFLCFRSSKQETKVYVDGMLRQEYSTANTGFYKNVSAVSYVLIPLYKSDCGKEIRIVTQSDTDYTGRFYEMYIGSSFGIWMHYARSAFPELVAAIFSLFIGLASVIVSFVLRLKKKTTLDLEYLGWGVFLASIWLITNSDLRQLLFRNMSIVNDIPFYMIMLLPIPFMLFMNSTQGFRYNKLYIGLISIAFVDVISCTLLHIFVIVNFADSIKIMLAVCFICIAAIFVTIFRDIHTRKISEYKLVAIGMVGVLASALAQSIIFFLKTVNFDGIILTSGVVFLLVMAMINTFSSILKMDKDKKVAIEAGESKSKFLASVSHEIRTPINAIIGMDEMILRQNPDKKIRTYAADIKNASQTLLSLVNDILDISKIESGKMDLIIDEYDLSNLIVDVTNMMKIKADAKGLEFVLEIEEKLPLKLIGDEARIKQILINLINNAIKYTEFGYVKLIITGKNVDDFESVHFKVEDSGMGIKEEDIPKLFSRFERIEEEKNKNIEGTGLGMNIVQELLALMGSKLDVTSEYGKGSCFSFDISQKICDKTEIGNIESRFLDNNDVYNYIELFTAPEANVLVVDDNIVNLKVVENLLEDTKVTVDSVTSGERAIERVKKKHYDIIFLDHMMPGMDGIETFHAMKNLQDNMCKDTPIIVLTANAITGAKESYLEEGFDDYLSKPILPDKLERLMLNYLPKELVFTERIEIEQEEDIVFPDIDGVDWEYAKLLTPKDSALLETVKAFYRSIEPDGEYLRKCFDRILRNNKDVEALNMYRIKVHAMKSTSKLVGLMSIFGLAYTLEIAAKNNDVQLVTSLTPAFLKQWDDCSKKLKVIVPADMVKKDATPVTRIEMLAYLNLLSEAAHNFDDDKATELMKEIDGLLLPDDVRSYVTKLHYYVEEIDLDSMDKCIDDIKALF